MIKYLKWGVLLVGVMLILAVIFGGDKENTIKTIDKPTQKVVPTVEVEESTTEDLLDSFTKKIFLEGCGQTPICRCQWDELRNRYSIMEIVELTQQSEEQIMRVLNSVTFECVD